MSSRVTVLLFTKLLYRHFHARVLGHFTLHGTFKMCDIPTGRWMRKWSIYEINVHEQWKTDPSFFSGLKQYFKYILINILFFWRLYKSLFSKKNLILINIRQIVMKIDLKHFFSHDFTSGANVAPLSDVRFIATVSKLAANTYSGREMLCTLT